MAKVDNKNLVKTVKARGIHEAIVHIKSSKNNTIAAVTDAKGNLVFSISGGKVYSEGGKSKLENTKKGTPYAAQKVLSETGTKMKELGIYFARLKIRSVAGMGYGRDNAALQGFSNAGVRVVSIEEITRPAHGGCRPPKPRKT